MCVALELLPDLLTLLEEKLPAHTPADNILEGMPIQVDRTQALRRRCHNTVCRKFRAANVLGSTGTVICGASHDLK